SDDAAVPPDFRAAQISRAPPPRPGRPGALPTAGLDGRRADCASVRLVGGAPRSRLGPAPSRGSRRSGPGHLDTHATNPRGLTDSEVASGVRRRVAVGGITAPTIGCPVTV